jgi:hypothetical protein
MVMKTSVSWFVLVATAFVAGQAPATVMLQLDLHQLAGRADLIVRGRVLETKSLWATGRIYTDSTLEVLERLHGSSERTIVVRRLGGTVGKIGMKVSGVAMLRKGDEVVLFTERRGTSRFVVGMAQGLFRLVQAAPGPALIERDLSGLLLTTERKAGMRLQAPESKRRTSVVEFAAQVREAIATCATDRARCASIGSRR